MKLPINRPFVWFSLLILCLLTGGCGQGELARDKNISPDHVTVLRVVGDSKQSMEAFRLEEETLLQRYGVRLEYHYPDRLSDNLEDFLFASTEPYDIYILFPAKIPQYVERNMLLPLDRYTAGDSTLNDVLAIYRKLYMNYQDHDYGMVFDGDAHLLFYRKDLFKKYNDEYRKLYGRDLTPPGTWQEYDRIARFLTRDLNGDATPDIYGTANFNGDAKRYVWFAERFLSMGGQFFDRDMNPSIQGKEGIKALEDWVALQDSGSTPRAMYDWLDLNNAFLQGHVAMVVQWSDTGRFSFDEKNWNSKVFGKVGWSQVPGSPTGGPRGGVWIGRSLAVSSKSRHPDKAWQVIQHITSPGVSARAVSTPSTINDPFRKSHFAAGGQGAFPDEATNRDFLKALEQSLKHTNADLMIPGGWEYMQVLDRHIGLALMHKQSAKEALERTAVEWEQITERYGREKQKEHYRQWLQNLNEVTRS